MVAQDKTSVDESDSVSMDVCVQSVMEEGIVPKIRKPYTISKQRERWTEEEHNKFLEALKLHGRAWRKIKEHVGTKTAVQIRSHAQKFFSKVVRETNNSNASTTDLIEIPPPRPKRKPSHPYPRKLVLPAKKEIPRESPDSSIYEQQDQSPTSVLSGLGSDTLASAYSDTPIDSPSPISSPDVVNEAEVLPSDDNTSEYDIQVIPVAPNDQVSVKLELFPSIDSSDKPESLNTKVLKLFGKEVVVPSVPSETLATCLSKSPSSDMGEELLQTSLEGFKAMDDVAMQTAENPWDCQKLYYVDGNGNHVEKPIPLPWWVFFKGIPVPPYECHIESAQEKGNQREGSCAGSSSESVNAFGNSDNNWDAESLEKSLLEERSNTIKASKGFVPYKRCYSERDMQSSSVSINEEEGRRIRLCL